MLRGNLLQYVKNKKPNVDIVGLVSIFSTLLSTVFIYADKISDIISGVGYLHGEGFVHRDLRAVRVYISMVIICANLFRPTFLWMVEALLALRTLV
jgi:serine/threonine protein kinase